MYCSSCGSQLPPGARVCPTCGIPTPSNVEPTLYDHTVPASPAYTSASDVPHPAEPVKQAEWDEERPKLSCMLETLGLYDHTTLIPRWKG